MAACHDDIDARGEPVAMLFASEGGIYERFGYGVATRLWQIEIDNRVAELRPELAPAPGSVRFLRGDDAVAHVAACGSATGAPGRARRAARRTGWTSTR